MSLLGSLFSLPSVPKLDLPSFDSKMMSYSTASPQKLIDESYTHVNNVFGSTGPFTSLGTNIPSFKDLGSLSFTGGLGSNTPFTDMANGELSKFMAVETPFTAGQVRDTVGEDAGDDDSHKVRLTADIQYSAVGSIRNITDFEVNNQMQVVFDIMPEVSENRDVSYEALSPSQLPGEFQKYKNTSSTKWTITAMFTARTRDEARQNYAYLRTLRTWTMPYFGDKQNTQFPNKLGAPPPIIMFSGWRGIVGEVPTVVTSVQWNWPNSCDWLPTGLTDPDTNREIPFPSVISVTINLVESFSPKQFNEFDLVAFHYGNMTDAWNGTNTGLIGSTRSGEAEGETTQVEEESLTAEPVEAQSDITIEEAPANDGEEKLKTAQTNFDTAKSDYQAALVVYQQKVNDIKAWQASNPNASPEERAAKAAELDAATAEKGAVGAMYYAAKDNLIAAGGTPS